MPAVTHAIRLLVPAYWLIGSLDVAASLWLADRLPAPLAAWQAAQAERAVSIADRLEQGWMIILLVALITGSLGLLRQRGWGKWLFLGANVAMFMSYPLLDALVYTWFGGLFADLSFVITGALLALAFFPPHAGNQSQ